MTIERKNKREHTITSSDILDRFLDGKIVDTAEMYDRWMISQQLGLSLPMPQKRNPNRVR
jgi:hypothetical protein